MKPTNPLPIWGLMGILLACAITFYLLVPNQKKLLNRLVQDGKPKRALEVLHSLPQTEKARDPEFYELLRLRLNRQLLNPKDKADFEKVMKGRSFAEIGKVTKKPLLIINGLNESTIIESPVADLRSAWKRTLSTEV